MKEETETTILLVIWLVPLSIGCYYKEPYMTAVSVMGFFGTMMFSYVPLPVRGGF